MCGILPYNQPANTIQTYLIIGLDHVCIAIYDDLLQTESRVTGIWLHVYNRTLTNAISRNSDLRLVLMYRFILTSIVVSIMN